MDGHDIVLILATLAGAAVGALALFWVTHWTSTRSDAKERAAEREKERQVLRDLDRFVLPEFIPEPGRVTLPAQVQAGRKELVDHMKAEEKKAADDARSRRIRQRQQDERLEAGDRRFNDIDTNLASLANAFTQVTGQPAPQLQQSPPLPRRPGHDPDTD